MKKLFILAALSALMLCSCKGNTNNHQYATLPKNTVTTQADQSSVRAADSEQLQLIVGKWVAESINGDKDAAAQQLPPNKCYMQISSDGSAEVSNTDAKSSARYEFDGQTLTMTAMNDTMKLTYSDGKLTTEYTGSSGNRIVIVYIKED